jgi:hypothetical protein
MLTKNVGRLLVVDRDNPTRLVGYLGRATILTARLRRLEEEHVREPGWLHNAAVQRSQADGINRASRS